MNELLFRQAVFLRGEFHRWHYWGFIDDAFIGPETNLSSPSEALKNSQMFTTLFDKNKVREYEGDILELRNIWETDTVNSMKYGIGVVKFGEWGCACGDYYCSEAGVGWYVEGTQGYDRRTGKIDRYEFLETILHCNEWLVIGNIYENPELRKEAK